MSLAQVPLPADDLARSRLLTPNDVAERLSVTPSCLANWRKSGSGPAFLRTNGIVRYPEADLDAFLAAARRSA